MVSPRGSVQQFVTGNDTLPAPVGIQVAPSVAKVIEFANALVVQDVDGVVVAVVVVVVGEAPEQ